jgi:FkbM family methyltransferase
MLNTRSDSSCPIIAFEPEPAIFALLHENVRANNLKSVTLRNVACGDAPGTLKFCTGINGNVLAGEAGGEAMASGGDPSHSHGESSGRTISVPVVRLDDELRSAGHIALIKIDCEGFEWHILNGRRETIAAHRPPLFLEIHPKLIGNFGHGVADICEMLRPGYHLRFWDAETTQRSPNSLTRFLGRYREGIVELSDERAMLQVATEHPRPDQLFLLATPR